MYISLPFLLFLTILTDVFSCLFFFYPRNNKIFFSHIRFKRPKQFKYSSPLSSVIFFVHLYLQLLQSTNLTTFSGTFFPLRNIFFSRHSQLFPDILFPFFRCGFYWSSRVRFCCSIFCVINILNVCIYLI